MEHQTCFHCGDNCVSAIIDSASYGGMAAVTDRDSNGGRTKRCRWHWSLNSIENQ